MSFLYPSFLWALTALSIPVIIHLFNFKKTTRIYFSNTRFLKQVKEATTAKRKLKHYLILLSRLLFLAFLIFAFAQPIIPAVEQLSNSRKLVVYLDNSMSMSAQLADKTKGLDAGLQFTRDIVELFPPDTQYKLVTNDFAPFSNSFKTKAEIIDLLTEVRLSPVSRSMEEIKEKILLSQKEKQEIFWISDFQKSTLGLVKKESDSTVARWHIVPLQFSALSNVFVDSVYLENPFAASGEKNVLHASVHNDGKKDIEQLNLKLTINGIQGATSSVSILQGSSTETNFDLTSGLHGLNKGKISFNDFPVSFDNEFYFALNFSTKINIVEIKNGDQVTPVERVFGNRAVFNFHGYTANNFNYALIAKADLLVVNGLNSIDRSLTVALRNYIENFGTVLIIPGATPDEISYSSLLQLPSLKSSDKKELSELDRPDFNNPFFENVFEEKTVSLTMPSASKVLDWGLDRSAILHFKNDQPYLSVFNQKGKVYLMASPLLNDFTNFHNNALFVPVMYRIAASSKHDDTPLYYTLSQNLIELRADSLQGEEPVRLVGDQEVVPSQRKVAGKIFMDVPKFSVNRGFYNIVANRDIIGLVAFNIEKKESLMEQYTGEEIKELMGGGNNITLFEAASKDTFSNEIKARYLGKPLWKYAIMIALFFLLVEILLIRFLK